MDSSKTKDDGSQAVITHAFVCARCGLSETIHYKGKNPPFSRKTELKYPSYVMKDPFSPPGNGEILIMGSDCAICEEPVCVDKQCSLFYLRTYCLECVKKTVDKLPQEITNKLKKKS